MKKCVNDDKPVHPPSKVLCKECFEKLSGKFKLFEKMLSDSIEILKEKKKDE